MRAACLSADIVIADLTWGDTLPPSFFLDYDLVLIPVSLSAIDLDSLQDFFRRFSNVFNSAAQNGPKIAVVPNRVNDIANYQSIFSKAA